MELIGSCWDVQHDIDWDKYSLSTIEEQLHYVALAQWSFEDIMFYWYYEVGGHYVTFAG